MESSLIELARYRYETSLETLEDAKIMYVNGRYKNALNRSYYTIFHAMRSVNSLKGFDSSKHSGVIAFFNQNYVKEGIFPKELSRIIRSASLNREKADYLDFFVASREEAEKQIIKAEIFQSYIAQFLHERNII